MWTVKIHIESNKCTHCGREFTEDEYIYRSNDDKKGCFYCSECDDKRHIQAMYRKCSDNAVSRLELKSVFDMGDGIYKVDMSQNSIEEFREYKNTLNVCDTVCDDIMTLGSDAVEIRDGNVLWYFSKSSWVEKNFAYTNYDVYKKAGAYIMPELDISDWSYFIQRGNKIIGIASVNFEDKKEKFKSYRKTMSVLHYAELFSFKQVSKSELQKRLDLALRRLTPNVMLSECQQRIQGQPMLKKAVFIVYSYLQALEKGDLTSAENWLLTAPSGSGKTEFYRTIRDIFKKYQIPVPVVSIDLSLITEAGFKGDNVDEIHDKLRDADDKSDGYCICFLDEADKKCLPSYAKGGSDVNSAVQSNLLTLVEGMDISTRRKKFDTSKTMFVFLGSFQDVRDQKQAKQCCKGIGFGSVDDMEDFVDKAAEGFYDDISLQDMVDYGMKEELAGRISRVINFGKIPETDMRKLIRCKAYEIGNDIGYSVDISDDAVEDLLATAYGTLGVRRPMNLMRELIQDAVSEIFFDDNFDRKQITVVVKSAEEAWIKKRRKSLFPA